ncbi:hypothetical protein SteCoe_24876 [Stentor coeruleus]|uniref:Uncharacterized protein n=1 Tax=Stentor coeruleus TaxID=5963 RepID=A0A1R2BGY3_9CILI|nr:hypothetical protein SteCoe_24876 [Stentor coeruleus]
MQVRNSSIGKLVVGSDRSEGLPNLNQLSYHGQNYTAAKGGVGQHEIPELIIDKKIIINPPQTDFKVQDYPLKRIRQGRSGWDWQTEVSEEYDLADNVTNCKPKYNTFSKLFPSRNFGMYPVTKPQRQGMETSPVPDKEFNIRHDRISEYREAMLKAQQLFKIN